MKLDWGQVMLTIGVAAATSLAMVGATVGLKPTGVQVREYLLAHAKDDWTNVERALAVPVDEVVTQLR